MTGVGSRENRRGELQGNLRQAIQGVLLEKEKKEKEGKGGNIYSGGQYMFLLFVLFFPPDQRHNGLFVCSQEWSRRDMMLEKR